MCYDPGATRRRCGAAHLDAHSAGVASQLLQQHPRSVAAPLPLRVRRGGERAKARGQACSIPAAAARLRAAVGPATRTCVSTHATSESASVSASASAAGGSGRTSITTAAASRACSGRLHCRATRMRAAALRLPRVRAMAGRHAAAPVRTAGRQACGWPLAAAHARPPLRWRLSPVARALPLLPRPHSCHPRPRRHPPGPQTGARDGPGKRPGF